MTASVGVPLTEKRRSPWRRRRIGRDKVREWPAPDYCSAGATAQTSSESFAAIRSSTSNPGAWMPSSLVIRMRIEAAMLAVLKRDNHLRLIRNNPQLNCFGTGQFLLRRARLTMSALGILADPL